MSENCVFCKIFRGDIPSNKVYESEKVIAFRDINPQAATHLLFIHKEHSKDFHELTKQSESSLLELLRAVNCYAETSGLYQKGYRVVTNIGQSAGQTVFHTHLHILSDEQLSGFGS